MGVPQAVILQRGFPRPKLQKSTGLIYSTPSQQELNLFYLDTIKLYIIMKVAFLRKSLKSMILDQVIIVPN